MPMMMPTVLLMALLTMPSTIPTRSAFVVSFSTTITSTSSSTSMARKAYRLAERSTAARRRDSFHHRRRCANDDDDGDISIGRAGGDSIRNGSGGHLPDSTPVLERTKTPKGTTSLVSNEEANDVREIYAIDSAAIGTRGSGVNNTATTAPAPQSLPYYTTALIIIEKLVSIKEKAYGVIRRILSDLVTILTRSVKKGANWIEEDETRKLVSSSLALVAFFASVAAFAVWNIQVLSGGKSQWSGPENGVTVPVIRGVPATPTTSELGKIGSPTVVSFQKPKWKAPKIRASYSEDNNKRERKDEMGRGGTIIKGEVK